jgi:hypothetical protein
VGKPLLLLEAASRYRGDQEDRLTEVLAAAMHENADFCGRLLKRWGLNVTPDRYEIATQQTFLVEEGRVRIDLVVRAFDAENEQRAIVFLESKYNPQRSLGARWFDPDQSAKELAALSALDGSAEKRLVAIVSDCDLHHPTRLIPGEYDKRVGRLGWREVGDLADEAGGPSDWKVAARAHEAPASQRVLLEFVSYLKGDAMGALNDDDLLAITGAERAQKRIDALLERAAEGLRWDETLGDDWQTGGGAAITYVAGEAPADTWLHDREEGLLYALIADRSWDDEAPTGEPRIYAGWGFSAKREEREATAASPWADGVRALGVEPIFDDDGIYGLASRPLSQMVDGGTATLSGQVNWLVAWVQGALLQTLAVPGPPPAQRSSSGSRRRRH